MLNPKNVYTEANVVNIDFKLDDRQRAILVSQTQHEGFDIMQRIMVDIVREFNTALMNTDVKDKDAVLANHIAAKVAAQIYEGFFERIRSEIELHSYNAQKLGTPENPEPAQVLPEFLGGENE